MESSLIEKMKVPELRTKLKELGLDSKGLKAELIQRINAHREALRKNRISNNDDRDEDEDDDSEENGDDESEKGEVDDNGEDEDYEELIEVVTNNKVVNSILEKVKKLTKRGKNAAYYFTAKFDKIEDALNTVINEKLWIKGTKKETKSEGLRQNYFAHFINQQSVRQNVIYRIIMIVVVYHYSKVNINTMIT